MPAPVMDVEICGVRTRAFHADHYVENALYAFQAIFGRFLA